MREPHALDRVGDRVNDGAGTANALVVREE